MASHPRPTNRLRTSLSSTVFPTPRSPVKSRQLAAYPASSWVRTVSAKASCSSRPTRVRGGSPAPGVYGFGRDGMGYSIVRSRAPGTAPSHHRCATHLGSHRLLPGSVLHSKSLTSVSRVVKTRSAERSRCHPPADQPIDPPRTRVDVSGRKVTVTPEMARPRDRPGPPLHPAGGRGPDGRPTGGHHGSGPR